MTGDADIELMAHLMRRAGFGAGLQELEAYAAKGYDAAVEELLSAAPDDGVMSDFLVRRFHHEQSGQLGRFSTGGQWLYRMATTRAPLTEKMALFWHSIFATGYAKVVSGKVLSSQIDMFRRHGAGSFRTLLVELSKDPAMIVWLDNQDNHSHAINENYGRELLELFTMGVGNYTEADIKDCARAFTGWTIGNTEYSVMRARRDSVWPYGRHAWHFEYRPKDHDDGDKEFLGHQGRFNGEDIVDIICQQPATARFISRHMYHFFVADEPPVPQWQYTPARDPEAIDTLVQAYFENDYDIAAMLRVLFNSDFFKSQNIRYGKVKSPTEMMAGVLRLTGEFDRPRHEMMARINQTMYMGQLLVNPPTVEGWHQGTEWTDTGTLVERINFAAEQMGDAARPGVAAMAEEVLASLGESPPPEALVDACLAQMGAMAVSDATRATLIDYASGAGGPPSEDGEGDPMAMQTVPDLLRMAAATQEFQLS